MAQFLSTDLQKALLQALTILSTFMDLLDRIAAFWGLREIPEAEIACSDCDLQDTSFEATIEEVVKSIPVIRFEEEICADEQCTVCLNELQKGEIGRRMPLCKHGFHKECIDGWIRHNHTTCPLCRSSLLSEELLHRLKNLRDNGEIEEWVLSLYLSPQAFYSLSA